MQNTINQTVWIVIWILIGGIGSQLLFTSAQNDIVIVYPDELAVNRFIEAQEDMNDVSLNSLNASVNTIVTGQFVASKNGTKYYPQGCSGINRIKEENRIYFNTEQEALESGREKSSLCQ